MQAITKTAAAMTNRLRTRRRVAFGAVVGLAPTSLGYPKGMRVHIESDAISSAGRAAHDISLGALIGGNLFARTAMHPSLALVTDPRDRGRVVNTAWRRYGVVNSLALSSLVAGWLPARL